jgi:methylated-DNA-[protein]-cysteine S-methyltransferase
MGGAKTEYIHHCETPLGAVTLASDGEALTGLWFEGQKYYAAVLDSEHEEKDLPVFRQTESWLKEYFAGRDPGSTPPLRLKGSAFRLAVWDILLGIPCGKTVTYGGIAKELARRAGRGNVSAQAVGGAVAHNPVSIIVPCHRVLGADGSLTGYAGGTERKAKLLALEGAAKEARP